ncbi:MULTISPECIES: sugar phosphorylase [unclassified Clostridioides]|uniref:sugar phosphorylase n=1 Tax=unclassified Clostridioides TaxID=2635829 RepID=UPI001D110288|nr:sugar phosphorylase [Clostridioides sp. ES-S-0171-01]UDN55224.1 sugar phosphorylase [Clostridioides sp. ES-S-0054-01]
MNKTILLQGIEQKLKEIYKEKYKPKFFDMMKATIEKFEGKDFDKVDAISEKNVYLITYGDSIYEEGVPTIDTLKKFLNNKVGDTITDVHILPMFEYTSDDGFSVVDYMKIDNNLGNWDSINNLSKDYRLMYDFVANHISKSSRWFKGYLSGEEKYQNYFIPGDKNFDYSNVVRPRTSPIIHKYQGKDSVKTAWTTFSEDQIDINVKHFPVLIEITEVLLNYALNGANSIRLDAIGFLWKESGTTCIHLPQTHMIIQLWRIILDYFKKNTQIITETNVPHLENISYFGDTTNEAHMVYQFTLPPLTLHTFTTHDSTKLTKWASTIDKVSDNATFFNFLASHDGIGMRPTEGILTEEECKMLVDKTIVNGGRVSYKDNPDGTKSVYELNINYLDALLNKDEDIEEDVQIQKILSAHALLLSFIGVPAIYYHSLLCSRNYYEGVEKSGINRRINREKLEYSRICYELENNSRRNKIFTQLKNMIDIRKEESAFSPYANQNVLDFGREIFALERENKETNEKVVFVTNVTSNERTIDCGFSGVNILENTNIKGKLTLGAYKFAWIKIK